jgi:ribosomal protein S18 acetylase RimI-like enzyme
VSEHGYQRAVSIQSAGPEHLPEIAAVATVIWRAHYPGIIPPEQIDYMLGRMYDVEVMRKEIDSGIVYDRLLVNGELTGFASYGPNSNSGELKLHKLYVHPARQRQGLGTLLLNHVEAIARQRAFTHLVLAVNKRNRQAIAAYLKHGFAIRESVVVDIGGGFVMDDHVMAKPL